MGTESSGCLLRQGPGFPQRMCLAFPPLFCAGDRGRAEFTQGPRAGWRGCRCSSAPPLSARSARLSSSGPGPLGPSRAPLWQRARPPAPGGSSSRPVPAGKRLPVPGSAGGLGWRPPVSLPAAGIRKANLGRGREEGIRDFFGAATQPAALSR